MSISSSATKDISTATRRSFRRSTLNSRNGRRDSRKVFLFIHGFNTMFAEGLYRLAQLAHDLKAPGVPVLFTWASRGKATAYVYDLNSATAARDGLEHTLRLLLSSNAEKVNVLAHSMGNWVTVEAFRQIKISGDLSHADKIGYVFLAAPDIDIDVFKSQMRRFGNPRKPSTSSFPRTTGRCFSRGRSGAASPGSATAPTSRARHAGRDRHRPHRPQSHRRDEPRQIRSIGGRRARPARRSRPGAPSRSPRQRRG